MNSPLAFSLDFADFTKLAAQLLAYRLNQPQEALAESRFLLTLAPYLNEFLGRLFKLEKNFQAFKQAHAANYQIIQFNRQIIRRKWLKKLKNMAPPSDDWPAFKLKYQSLFNNDFSEAKLYHLISQALLEPEKDQAFITIFIELTWLAIFDPQAQAEFTDYLLFKMPELYDDKRLFNWQK